MDLTDEQWAVLKPLLPEPPRRADGPKLRRYKRRWKIERLFAWLENFRRLVVRYERRPKNYLGFVQLGCAVSLLRGIGDARSGQA